MTRFGWMWMFVVLFVCWVYVVIEVNVDGCKFVLVVVYCVVVFALLIGELFV